MTEKKIWSMDELVALTDEVQTAEVDFRDGTVEFQFCELTEKEEPKFTGVSDDLPEEEKRRLKLEKGENTDPTREFLKMAGLSSSSSSMDSSSMG